MPRRLRYVPPGGALIEITCRTVQSRLLMRPSAEINDLICGVLGRAQRRHAMRICALVFMGNHFHMLLDVDDAHQLSRFMAYLKTNLAKEIGRHVGWRDGLWARRYQAILISDEERAQAARLSYILQHGVKESLVRHPAEWPGVHSVHALTKGTALTGHWFDRSREYAVRRRGKGVDRLEFATVETIELSPLPCWRGLNEATIQATIAGMVAEIESRYAAFTERILGRLSVLSQDPQSSPHQSKRSPAPLVHAATKRARQLIREAYRSFEAAFRGAAQRLREGAKRVVFPEGSFPPALPFVEFRRPA